jgi:ADP-ribosylglycohydrolase
MTVPTVDSYIAALLGELVGDIRGARYEHKKQREIAEMISRSGGIALDDFESPWPGDNGKIIRGDQPTDDSEATARYAQALTRVGAFDAQVIYHEQRLFMIDRQSMLADEPIGQGSTLKSALEPLTYLDSLYKFGRGETLVSPSNGALMRNTPTYLMYQGREDHLVRYSKWQSCITHTHPLSQVACIAHSLMGSLILDGLHPVEAWRKTKEILSDNKYKKMPDLDAILELKPTEITEEELWPKDKDHTGHVIHSLRIAIWAATTARNYRDGIEKCIRIGGDTDTYAAIAGGFLGAHFGMDSFPSEWLANAQGLKVMIDLAQKLHKLAVRT